jgi:hypothetical protein
MEDLAPSRRSSTLTERQSTMEMLAIPRPQTRADCLQEARPCPWVGCRHHLLIDVTSDADKAGTLVLNRPSNQVGRRRGLASSAAAVIVETWIDDAIEQLFRMRDTCELDVLDRRGAAQHPNAQADPLTNVETAAVLNVREQTANERFNRARGMVRDALELDDDDELDAL